MNRFCNFKENHCRTTESVNRCTNSELCFSKCSQGSSFPGPEEALGQHTSFCRGLRFLSTAELRHRAVMYLCRWHLTLCLLCWGKPAPSQLPWNCSPSSGLQQGGADLCSQWGYGGWVRSPKSWEERSWGAPGLKLFSHEQFQPPPYPDMPVMGQRCWFGGDALTGFVFQQRKQQHCVSLAPCLLGKILWEKFQAFSFILSFCLNVPFRQIFSFAILWPCNHVKIHPKQSLEFFPWGVVNAFWHSFNLSIEIVLNSYFSLREDYRNLNL